MNLSLGKRPFPPRFVVSSQYNNRKEDTEMETKRTELVFILDRSGSMSGLESDTIGGFNGLLEEQRQGDGAVTVTTVLFDHAYTLLHDRLDIRGVRPITRQGTCFPLYCRSSSAVTPSTWARIFSSTSVTNRFPHSIR